MSPAVRESVLTRANIDCGIQNYLQSVDTISGLPADLRGVDLLSALKRRPVGLGPYPYVTWMEAANRVMTDLVLLFGVRWLLTESAFPFSEYRVEFGHGNQSEFDLMAESADQRLIGEAFNVSPSLFQAKKAAMLKKLRNKGLGATHTIILCNVDAVHERYGLAADVSEYHLLVDVKTGAGRLLSNRAGTLVPVNAGSNSTTP